MAQQQNKQNRPKQPQDPYAQKGKQLASAVQRLRGWVGSDPSRTPELADALVVLTEHRLLGHAYTVAAPEAQEAVKLAAQQLTANGPIGPYTSVADAARYVTAVVHLGVIQAAAGLPEAAAETVGSFAELREQVGAVPLAEALAPSTVVWALACTARGALAGGDVAAANAYADAALQRLAEAGLRSDADAAYVVVDADRLVSDARWAAGLAEDALTHLHAARDTYDRVVDGRLAQPGRLSPALLQRLAEPLFGVYRDLADRLLAVGEVDLGLVTRRQLIELLGGIAAKDETARVQLAGSLGDLVRDLRALDRTEEADLVAEELAARPAPERKAAGELSTGIPRGSGPVRWEPLGPEAAYAGAQAGASANVAALEAELQREAADRLAAERSEAHRLEQQRLEEARREAERREAERAEEARRAAERAQAEQAEAARREFERIEAARAETERLAAEEEAERRERQRRREERMEAHRLEAERQEAERIEAERAAMAQREAERRAADPAEMERIELERLQAEIAALEAAEAESARAESARGGGREGGCERAEAERAEAESLEQERREQERLARERAEAEWLEGERRAGKRPSARKPSGREQLRAKRTESLGSARRRQREPRPPGSRESDRRGSSAPPRWRRPGPRPTGSNAEAVTSRPSTSRSSPPNRRPWSRRRRETSRSRSCRWSPSTWCRHRPMPSRCPWRRSRTSRSRRPSPSPSGSSREPERQPRARAGAAEPRRSPSTTEPEPGRNPNRSPPTRSRTSSRRRTERGRKRRAEVTARRPAPSTSGWSTCCVRAPSRIWPSTGHDCSTRSRSSPVRGCAAATCGDPGRRPRRPRRWRRPSDVVEAGLLRDSDGNVHLTG